MRDLPPLPEDPIMTEIEAFSHSLSLGKRYRELDTSPEFPWTEFRAMGKAHLLGLRTPVSLGGRGLPLPSVGTALFHLAYWGGTTFAKLSLQPEFSSVLAEHGSPDLVEQYFRGMVRGEALIGNHVTEPGAGSDVAALSLTADEEKGGYILNGIKSEIAFAGDASAAIVYGRVRHGSSISDRISAFLVPQDLPGIAHTLQPDMGERWMRRGRVEYTGVHVPASSRIGEEGEAMGYLKEELTRERALLAAIYLGVARASWEETVRHVEARKAFGRRLADQEAVSFSLVEDWAKGEAAWLYTKETLATLEAGRDAVAQAALAKWMATETALATLDHAIQFHGGRGYSKELPHEQRWRDVRSGAIAHGPAEIMHVVAARTLWPRG